MNTTRFAAVLVLLISIALWGLQTPSPVPSISVTSTGNNFSIAGGSRQSGPPGQTPVYRINLRVHNGQSTLPAADLRTLLGEMNFIWWSQAGVCFEITSTKDDITGRDGLDIWFVPLVPDPVGVNGVYKGDHDIWSRDHPSLRPAPNPVTHPAARTSAHELGHALTLPHYNGYADSAESLMSSGTLGWHLHAFQIQAARTHAHRKALPDMTPINCGAPQIN
jgi:hypothetical protein